MSQPNVLNVTLEADGGDLAGLESNFSIALSNFLGSTTPLATIILSTDGIRQVDTDHGKVWTALRVYQIILA